jgi:plastocyanin
MPIKKLSKLAMVLVLGTFLVNPLIAAEGEEGGVALITKVVIITGHSGLKPPDIISQRGTTVVWVNHSNTPQEILFLDKKVVLACGSPVNFIVGHDGAYESSKVPFGGTASLCFTEKGSYEYIVKSSKTFAQQPKDKKYRGSVTIE